jgi:hypothetical protein
MESALRVVAMTTIQRIPMKNQQDEVQRLDIYATAIIVMAGLM